MKLRKDFKFLVIGFCLIFGSRLCTSNDCPEYAKQCDCSTDGMYDCSNRTLTSMINKTDDDIRTLDLSNNHISQTVVLDASYLTYLSLANNSLMTVKYDTFDNLDELKTLRLSNNIIRRITDDVFEWNPLKLEVLYLDNNNLEFIQHFLLYDLEQLTELYLQNNLITFIHSHAFNQLKKLRVVRLEGNHLHMFDSKWFRGLKANMFEEIRLNDNPWSCDCAMQPHSIWIKNTKWFKRLMKHDDLICTMPDEKKTKRVRDLKLDSHLRCDKPDITGISVNTSLYVNESIQLDCVVDKTTLPVPQMMWVAPNSDHYNLQTADRYDGIEVFQNGSLIIHKVTLNDTGEYTCVATVNRTSVQATMVLNVTMPLKGGEVDKERKDPNETEDFERQVHKHTECPRDCTCVAQHVDCSSDDGQGELTEIPIAGIPAGARTVSVASNNITHVPVFPSLEHLTELRLDNNMIDSIESKAFDNLTNLQTLTIRDNKLTTFPHRLLKKLTKLTILVLDNNQLNSIDSNLLYGLKGLQWLYIRHNLITSIAPDAFSTLKSIKFIHLENNELPSLQKDTIKSLVEKKHVTIQKMFIDFNLFNCDCTMETLRVYLRSLQHNTGGEWNGLFGDGVKCNFPVSRHDEFLIEIKESLTCNATEVPVVVTFGGNDGGKKCHFPFEFKNEIYNKCIKIDALPFNSTVWCATTESYSRDAKWGACRTSDYTFVSIKAENNESGALSGLWFAGLIVGFILCAVGYVLYRKYGDKFKGRSMKYSNIPGYDDVDEHRTLTSGGSNGTEAFV